MRKASTGTLEQGIQAPSPAPDLIPAETSTENLHWDWYNTRGHVNRADMHKAFLSLACALVCWNFLQESGMRATGT